MIFLVSTVTKLLSEANFICLLSAYGGSEWLVTLLACNRIVPPIAPASTASEEPSAIMAASAEKKKHNKEKVRENLMRRQQGRV